jgi:glycerol-3-phosphate dehydrogenase
VSGKPVDELWQLEIADDHRGTIEQVSARALVNTAGPWVAVLSGIPSLH